MTHQNVHENLLAKDQCFYTIWKEHDDVECLSDNWIRYWWRYHDFKKKYEIILKWIIRWLGTLQNKRQMFSWYFNEERWNFIHDIVIENNEFVSWYDECF